MDSSTKQAEARGLSGYQRLTPYLSDREFTNRLVVPVETDSPLLLDRIGFLCDRLAGQSVIHVGCVDHEPLIEEKRRRGEWLHERLMARSKRVVGVDINGVGIEAMRRLGIQDLFTGDVLDPEFAKSLCQDSWDTMLIGEVLEHIGNPVEFLSKIQQNFAGHVDRLVLTVPNAFKLANFLNSLKQREIINSDHRFWFSPYTLMKLGTDAGFEVEGLWLSQMYPITRSGVRHRVVRWALTRYPMFRDGLILSLRWPQ